MHNIKTNFDKILGVVKDIIGREITEKGNYLRTNNCEGTYTIPNAPKAIKKYKSPAKRAVFLSDFSLFSMISLIKSLIFLFSSSSIYKIFIVVLRFIFNFQ